MYAPAAHLEKGSAEYDALAASGKCWHDYFDPGNLRYTPLPAFSVESFPSSSLPDPSTLLPTRDDPSAISEVRNHLIVCHWTLSDTDTNAGTGTAGLDEPTTQALSALMLRDTESAALYASSWGG
ncbi:hypothetical protein AJ79_09941 [Helicocarpus griseus UAMH5409]|uniref:Uncharacterized protein n=1 Tax=Helicocarpus griseus UAMH5409 TaxID=1447875 RepID=A0A2B7WG30_9EURO|nr:hypothetical protein AJ79_09941 [Helicocarpus griseus UAMH5409]